MLTTSNTQECWRENSKRYRDKQAAAAKGSHFIEENTPPNSPVSSAIINLGRASSSRKKC